MFRLLFEPSSESYVTMYKICSAVNQHPQTLCFFVWDVTFEGFPAKLQFMILQQLFSQMVLGLYSSFLFNFYGNLKRHTFKIKTN